MNGINYDVPHCGAYSTPHFHISWAQIVVTKSMANGSRRFNTAFIRDLQVSPFRSESIQILVLTPKLIVILLNMYLGLPSGLFPVGLFVRI